MLMLRVKKRQRRTIAGMIYEVLDKCAGRRFCSGGTEGLESSTLAKVFFSHFFSIHFFIFQMSNTMFSSAPQVPQTSWETDYGKCKIRMPPHS